MKVDPKRTGGNFYPESGIFVRAQGVDGKWGSFDISELTADSLLEWLRSRGGKNEWAEDTVGLILGHGRRITEL